MKYLLSLLMAFCAPALLAQTAIAPALGDGSPENPYQIATLGNLYWITVSDTSWDKCFIQTADIDASATAGWFPDGSGGFNGWLPITLTAGIPFSGTYDGQAYEIAHLSIHRPSVDSTALFASTENATLKGIRLTSVDITGGTFASALAGVATASSILQCSSSGSVTGSGNATGGLIGQNDGTITDCSSSCTVHGGPNMAGGLVGLHNSGTILRCSSTGSVSGDTSIGGLIGDGEDSVCVSFSTGTVTSTNDEAGGLIGYNGGTVANCYSTGAVSANQTSGGLIGVSYGAVNHCYSTGTVTSTSATAYGLMASGGTDSDNYWDEEASTVWGSEGATGKTTLEMKTFSTYAGWDTTLWTIDPDVNLGYPFFIWQPTSGGAMPVELVSFTAQPGAKETIVLRWTTATEANNYGFDIERRTNGGAWKNLGFVEGHGTTNAAHSYSFSDAQTQNGGALSYRLKQIDRNGKFIYSHEVVVQSAAAPAIFALTQNYPNPFNPSTTITFTVPSTGHAVLKIFNTLGQEITTLFDGEARAGFSNTVEFNAVSLASGMYFSRLEAQGRVQIRKMLLMK